MPLTIDFVLDQRDDLGESPLWDSRDQCLYWIDSRRRLVQRLHPESGDYQSWYALQDIGSIALCESGRILVALQNDLQFLDTSSGDFSHFIDIHHPAERMRLNDGRTDKAGRLCLGSLVLGRHEQHGVLYQIDSAGQVNLTCHISSIFLYIYLPIYTIFLYIFLPSFYSSTFYQLLSTILSCLHFSKLSLYSTSTSASIPTPTIF